MKVRLSLYWWCQIMGWGVFTLLATFFYFAVPGFTDFSSYSSLIITALLGLFTSHLMRLFIIKVNVLNRRVWQQFISLFFITVLFSIFYLIFQWITEVIQAAGEFRYRLNFWQALFAGIFINAQFFTIWNLIYFTYHYIKKSQNERIQNIRLESELRLQQLESEKTKAEWQQHKTELEMQALLSQVNEMQKLQQMRLQIASDLHDDIGSTLNSISFYSELVKMQLPQENTDLKSLLDKIGNNARSAVTTMSDTVWMIKPENDFTENLIAKMRNHAAEICQERNIACHFEADEINQGQLNMLQRKNMYLVFKEALHNAVKHSNSNSISICFSQSNSELQLTVTDNGKGFHINQVNGNGNGLTNMKRRATEINGVITIQSELNQGTSVMLQVKIT